MLLKDAIFFDWIMLMFWSKIKREVNQLHLEREREISDLFEL